MADLRTYLRQQPWIYRPGADALFILFPAFLAVFVVLIFPDFFGNSDAMPPWAWLLFIVGIDVAHVYSTLWRTYLDPDEFQRYKRHLTLIPFFGWVVGTLLYFIDPMLFWRVLAYLAVFHFIRQQYGFMSLYARKDKRAKWERTIDAVTIYAATLFPLLYWHTHLPRNFHWFVDGDFGALSADWLTVAGAVVYVGILLIWLGKEVYMLQQGRRFNLPKNLILIGTMLSWYYGIVVKNGDLAFTATNVVAHGIPYMALVWMYGRKKVERGTMQAPKNHWIRRVFRWQYLPVFIGVLLLFAYLEEGLWDALIWRDHEGLFPWAAGMPFVGDAGTLAWLVPLLALPQVTHYVIDGFIWKVRKPGGEVGEVLN